MAYEAIERDERDFYDAGATMYVGRCDGVIAGGASLMITGGIAQFTGAATAPAYRRRGIQNALLARRLTDAAEAGCDIAVITTAPGSKSQENAQRRGFQLLYTRAMLIKPVDGPIQASGSGENGSGTWKLVSAQGMCVSSETAGTDFAEPVRIVPFVADCRPGRRSATRRWCSRLHPSPSSRRDRPAPGSAQPRQRSASSSSAKAGVCWRRLG